MTVLYKTIKLKLIERQKACFPAWVPVILPALWECPDEGPALAGVWRRYEGLIMKWEHNNRIHEVTPHISGRASGTSLDFPL